MCREIGLSHLIWSQDDVGSNPTTQTMSKELRELFLTLWDKAVGTKNYSKKQWQELESLIRKEIKKDK